jgi:hypothetical protein
MFSIEYTLNQITYATSLTTVLQSLGLEASLHGLAILQSQLRNAGLTHQQLAPAIANASHKLEWLANPSYSNPQPPTSYSNPQPPTSYAIAPGVPGQQMYIPMETDTELETELETAYAKNESENMDIVMGDLERYAY